MAEYTGSVDVDASPGALFAYLSEVGNLPDYFSSMTSAEPSGGEVVRTTARLPEGQEVEGEAWFWVDEAAQRIEWGSQGPNDYHGSLDVDGEGDASRVRVNISTERVTDGDVDRGISETLANVKRLVEGA